jgi:hypothetical protein
MRPTVTETLRIRHTLSIQQVLRPVLLTREIHNKTLAQTNQICVVHIPLVLDVDACQLITLQSPGYLLGVHGIRLHRFFLARRWDIGSMHYDVLNALLCQSIMGGESAEACLVGRQEVRFREFLVQSVKELFCIRMLSE